MPDARHIEVIEFPGRVPYPEMLARQHARRREVEAHAAPNTLYLLEHDPVITLGRSAHAEHVLLSREALAEHGIEVCAAERGGDVTYHGPGQLVAYPLLDLKQWRCSVGWYLRALEEVLIRVLAHYGLPGERLDGHTGVWVHGAKVAAIGVALHQWTTFHGIALNVHPDLRHFQYIVPCGIADKPVTSMEQLLGGAPDFDEVKQRFREEFLGYFAGA